MDEFALYGLIVDLGPATAASLSRATGLAPTTLSGIITRCEQRGDLVKVPNPADRRSSLLELTPAGMAAYQRLVPRLVDLLASLEAALELRPAEIRHNLQALDAAVRKLRGVGPRPYQIPTAPNQPLDYPGRRLTARQQREVLDYIDWIRHRDEAAAPTDMTGRPNEDHL